MVILLLQGCALLNAAQLTPEALRAWDAYVRVAKEHLEDRARSHGPFLWVDDRPDLLHRVQAGEIVIEPVRGGSPHAVPGALIHDWIGVVFIPKTNLYEVMGVLSEFDRYKDFYGPMVVKSKLLAQAPDHAKISLMLVQKAFSITGAVETENQVDFATLGADRAYSLSTSIRVQEIADYGTPSQHPFAEGSGPGYVWRTFNITQLEQRDGGVFTQIEIIIMSRTIPLALRWLIQPVAEHLARNALLATLQETRDAVTRETKTAGLKTRTVPH